MPGLKLQVNCGGGSFKSQFKKADKIGAEYAIILGDDEVSRKELAIKSLPEKQQLVFNLRYYDEMPYQQMSELLDTSEGALKASYHHAAKKIEEFIKSY